MTTITTPGYTIRRTADAPIVPCPCGASTRVLTAADGIGCSLHVTEIHDSVRHYHRETAEVYYILDGSGKIELDGEWFPVEPGTVVYIAAGTRHRLLSEGGVRTIVFGIPAFRADDEWFD
jgi:mannose-6-phosphate isomerase-like protein (cupin superfamily)